MSFDAAIIKSIRKSRYFDEAWYRKTYLYEDSGSTDPLLHYLEVGAAAGADPAPTFSTKGYLAANPDVGRAGMNPLIHYIKAGESEGRSPKGSDSRTKFDARPPLPRYGQTEYGPVSAWLSYDRPLNNSLSSTLRVCVHLHLFHNEMWSEFLALLANMPVDFTLLVSVCTEEYPPIEEQVALFLPHAVNTLIRVLPNRGRDVAAWVVGFADEIRQHDVFCHLHSKRSDYEKSYAGWRQFLLHGVMGSPSVCEQILERLTGGKAGICAPPYFSALPGQPRWGANKEAVEMFLRKWGANLDSAKCPDFPAGSFFWARVDVVRKLLDYGLAYEDFEAEAGQLDGTLGHAIERLLGVLPRLSGREFELLGVDVAYNLKNYWDQRRLQRLEIGSDVKSVAYRPTRTVSSVSNGISRIAVIVCITGEFDEFNSYPLSEPGVDYYLVTDGSAEKALTALPAPFHWLPARYSDPNPRRTARFVKTHPHFYLNGYDYSVWIDANIVPLGRVRPLVNELVESGADLGLIAHTVRSSWKQEAMECARIKADSPELLMEQVEYYSSINLPEQELIETNIMVSNLKNPEVLRFYAHWWAEICRFSLRDQVSINAALAKCELKIHYIVPKGRSVRDFPGFLIFSHDVKNRKAVIERQLLTQVDCK